MGFLIETDELRYARERLRKERTREAAFASLARDRISETFKARGGCAKCGGRGWVVTWDTMDSLSGCYAEYGGCSAEGCSKKTRELTGLNKAYYSKYDGNRNTPKFKYEEALTEAEAAELAGIRAAIAAAEAGLLASEAGAYCAKGASVRVVRGRKVPRGTEGEIFWTGKDKFRGEPRVGFEARKGVVYWTAGSNLELIEAAPGYYYEGSY